MAACGIALRGRGGKRGDELGGRRRQLPELSGSLLGGYYGARLAQRAKQEHVRWVVIAIGAGMSAYFFWKTG